MSILGEFRPHPVILRFGLCLAAHAHLRPEKDTALSAAFDDSQQITPTQGRELALDDAVSKAQELLRHSLSPNTRRGYAADWRHFSSWGQANQRIALPALPGTVGIYLTALSETAKVSTLTRRISALSQAHQADVNLLVVTQGLRPLAHGLIECLARDERSPMIPKIWRF